MSALVAPPLLFDGVASLSVHCTHSEREEAAEAVRHMRSEASRLQQPEDGGGDPSSSSSSSWSSSSRLEAALDDLVAQVSVVLLAGERMAKMGMVAQVIGWCAAPSPCKSLQLS